MGQAERAAGHELAQLKFELQITPQSNDRRVFRLQGMLILLDNIAYRERLWKYEMLSALLRCSHHFCEMTAAGVSLREKP